MKLWVISRNQTIPWTLVFQAKAGINWIEAVLFLLDNCWIHASLQTEPLVNLEYSQLFYGAIFLIGLGYG